MAIILTICLPDYFESRISLKVSFTNIWNLLKIRKDSLTHIHSTAVYLQEELLHVNGHIFLIRESSKEAARVGKTIYGRSIKHFRVAGYMGIQVHDNSIPIASKFIKIEQNMEKISFYD